MQLDLFGFPIEEKPAKKQDKKAAGEKTPPKQEAPVQTKAFDPVTEEYTEVNIHTIPGLRQPTAAVAEPAEAVVTATTAPPESGQPFAETTLPEPVAEKQQEPVEDIVIPEEVLIIEDEPFIAETQPAEDIPVAVLEAMAEEIALLEEYLEAQEVITETPVAVAETPVSIAETIIEETGIPGEALHAKEILIEAEQPVEEIPVAAIEPMTGETAILDEPFVAQEVFDEAEQPMGELEIATEETAIFEEPAAEQDVAIADTAPPVTDPAIAETGPADEDNEPLEPSVEKPVAIAFEPTARYEEEPMLMLAATDDDVIEVNQTLFSRQSVEEMVSPARVALKAKGKRGRKSFKDIDAEIALVEVPDDEELFKKLYYPISQVAQWFNVNTSLLRFWENEFDVLKPRKNRKGDRMFRPEDVKNLQVIYHLLRQRKFSIEGAKKYIKQNKSRAEINIQLIQSLTKFRSFLLEMKANLGS